MATLPAVGTEEFRRLPYQQQLEIASLQLFDPDEYGRQIGEEEEEEPPSLDFPPLPEVDLPDLPVSFLNNYWAGYSVSYRTEWYGGNSPLLTHNICEQRLVNICTFTFPLIALTPPIFYIITYLKRHWFTSYSILSLTHACKVLVYLDQVLRGRDAHYLFSEWEEIKRKADRELIEEQALGLYTRALDCLRDVSSITQINEIQDTVEDNRPLLFKIQRQALVVHQQARCLGGRWFFPLVPSDLYFDGRFHIYNWGWLNDAK